MNVLISFAGLFPGSPAKAVWLIDSPSNRAWFAAQSDLDPGSAVFRPHGGVVDDAAIIHAVRDAQEHHPTWERIELDGVKAQEAGLADLQQEGDVAPTATGYLITRR